MRARQLGFLRIFALKLSSNRVEQLDVGLLRILLQRGDECLGCMSVAFNDLGNDLTHDMAPVASPEIIASCL